MKRILTFLFIITLASLLGAATLDLGVGFGWRQIKGDNVKDVYGNGTAFTPFVQVGIFKGLKVGFTYEFGYSKDGTVGIYNEDSTLKVHGWEAYGLYEFCTGKIKPYLRLGLASFSYKQEFSNSSYTQKVDDSKITVAFGGGVAFVPVKNVRLHGEVKYIPLKVEPYETEVDLGGMRLLVGAAYSFNL